MASSLDCLKVSLRNYFSYKLKPRSLFAQKIVSDAQFNCKQHIISLNYVFPMGQQTLKCHLKMGLILLVNLLSYCCVDLQLLILHVLFNINYTM